ncbi:hypothetical protein LCGC14_1186740 [marine sediment metagenome]|uniref:Uncharacterized protein n=1 Tax=marine sediment metagenome TaxID=412755 RepID=A0A0F9M8B7_9ZZZZ
MTDRLRDAAKARQKLIAGVKRASVEIAVEREALLEARRARREMSRARSATALSDEDAAPS